MWRRILQIFAAELVAFGAFVFGGLALLGGVVTWTGESSQPTQLSWLLVVLFASFSAALGKIAIGRLRVAFARSAE